MKSKRTIIGIIVVCLILASACNGERVDNAELEIENVGNSIDGLGETAEEETSANDYWDGGDFAGQSVYSLTWGVSQAAHDAFSDCGLRDNNVEHAVETYLQESAERQMVIAKDSQQEVLWSVAITVSPLTADVYEVDCSVVEP